MANKGMDTNGSQLYVILFFCLNIPSFITYKTASHLDGHHTVFGYLVGGIEVLQALEAVPTDAQDRPKV